MKVLQHITPGMYFGEVEILDNKPVTCRVTVQGTKPVVLLGFKKETLEYFFDKHAIAEWKAKQVLVRFPHEAEVRKETLIDWRVKALEERAFLDGLQGYYLQDEAQRDSYLSWEVQKRQLRLRPWYEAIKNQHLALKSVVRKSPPKPPKRSVSPKKNEDDINFDFPLADYSPRSILSSDASPIDHKARPLS